MSKVTRDQLKDLVKECLVEILSEGLASGSRGSPIDDASSLVQETHRPRASHVAQKMGLPPRSHSPALNSTVYSASRAKKPAFTEAPRRPAVVENIGQITSDPIMSQILADTASTTLQEHLAAESARPGISSQESVGSPMEIFEGAQHWAALAFADAGSKGQKLKS